MIHQCLGSTCTYQLAPRPYKLRWHGELTVALSLSLGTLWLQVEQLASSNLLKDWHHLRTVERHLSLKLTAKWPGINYIHQKNLVHADLKSSNILIDYTSLEPEPP